MKTIRFKDEGQDFLEWDVDGSGKVVACRPSQGWLWVGTLVVNVDSLTQGGTCLIRNAHTHGPVELVHPIAAITHTPAATLSKGQTVRVYGKPYTCEEYEGDAVLVRPVERLEGRGGMEWWQVRFVGEAAPCIRLVHVGHAVRAGTAVSGKAVAA